MRVTSPSTMTSFSSAHGQVVVWLVATIRAAQLDQWCLSYSPLTTHSGGGVENGKPTGEAGMGSKRGKMHPPPPLNNLKDKKAHKGAWLILLS